MPKRSAEEKLAHYQRKIRKINEDAEKKRHRRIMYSSDDEIIEETNRTEFDADRTEEPSETLAEMPEILTDDLQPLPTVPIPASSSPQPLSHPLPPPPPSPILEQVDTQVVSAPLNENPPEPPLDPELLSALGACTSDTPDFGERIHESLANLWLPLLRKGLPKEDKANLTKEYLIPSNCKLLQAPKLNAEISAAVSDVVRGRDKKLSVFQQQLGAGVSAVNRAMNTLLKADDKVQVLKNLSDGSRLLSDLHFCFTKDRTKLIIPSLEKNFLHVIQETERDDTLFGNSLGEKIKASKAIEKQGLQIRKVANTKSANPQTSTNRPTQQGNWTGPPRYPSNRGGRGGPRKPAPTTARRPYPTTTAQPPAKNYNQPKTRANVQH